MPHITGPLSIADGTLPTNVNRSFEVRKVDQALSSFAYKLAANDPRQSWITADVTWSDSSKNRPTVRQTVTVTYPLTRSVAGVPTVVATARAECSFVIPDQMTELEAEDLHAFLRRISQHDTIRVGVTKREPIFA